MKTESVRSYPSGRSAAPAWLLATAVLFSIMDGCKTSEESSSNRLSTHGALFEEGHRLYMIQKYDSAAVLLGQVLAGDSGHTGALADMAALSYDRAHTSPEVKRSEHLRVSREYYRRLEERGSTEAEVYERLCEISVALKDPQGFVKYAQRYTEKYPYDRQTYNLGVAYFEAGRFQDVVTRMKQAVAKFPASPYLGGFYVQMGRAYMKVDRDQTATRVLETGLRETEARLAAARSAGQNEASARLAEDRILILRTLQWLHRTYQETGKLERIERLLREAGQ